jgi:hypothetical protein
MIPFFILNQTDEIQSEPTQPFFIGEYERGLQNLYLNG